MAERKLRYSDLLVFLSIFILSIVLQNFLLGVIILFFFPGYLLLQLMYHDEPFANSGITIPLSIGISLVISAIIGLLHYYLVGNVFSVVITLWVFIGLLGILVVIRRLSSGGVINTWNFNLTNINFQTWDYIKAFSVMILFITFGYYYWLTSNQQPEFTEFYLLGPGGRTTGYPTEVTKNSPLDITVGVVNHEGETLNYTIVGLIGEEPIGVLHPFEVPDNERREGELTLIFPYTGENQRVEILLGIEGLEYSYRSLTLWVNVLEEDQ